jgi:hypothetical protein
MYNDLMRFPEQRLSYKEKIKDDYAWAKEVMDSLSSNYIDNYNPTVGDGKDGTFSDYKRKLANYQLYNNKLNQEDFERECNPLGLDIGVLKDEIQPYNKIPSKVQTLLGEEFKRRFNYKAITVNDSGVRTKIVNKTEQVRQKIYEKYNNLAELLRMRYDQGGQNLPQEERTRIDQEVKNQLDSLLDTSEIEKLSHQDFLDYKELAANALLNFLYYDLELKDKMNDSFKHGLIAGEEFVWVGVVDDKVVVEALNPLGIRYHKSPDVKYIEDGQYAGYQTMMSVGDIMDRWAKYMKKDEIEDLIRKYYYSTNGKGPQKEMKYGHMNGPESHFSAIAFSEMSHTGQYGFPSASQDIMVEMWEWRSEQKVYFITEIDEDGNSSNSIVNESFKIPSYAESVIIEKDYGRKVKIWTWDNFAAEEGWVPQVWQGVKIDDNIYCMIGPRENQYRSISNPKDIKLSFHGVVYNNTNASSVTMVDRAKPFQYLYFLVMHKLKRLIARDKGKLTPVDLSMIPEKIGIEKTLYYLEELDYDLFNSLENAEMPGGYQRSKVTHSIDRSNMQNIMNYVQLLDALDRQISDVAGVTKGREGQSAPNQAVTNNQQDIVTSNTLTEAIYFAPHYATWRRVLNSALQCAVELYKGKDVSKQYILDDLTISVLELTEDSLTEADFGVYISNYSRDNEIFSTLKQLAHSFIQNDKATMSDIIKIIKANSTQELEASIVQSELSRIEQEQEAQKQQIQAQQEQLKAQIDENEKERQLRWDIEVLKSETDLQEKEMDTFKFQKDQDINNNNVPDQFEIEKWKGDMKLKERKLDIEEKKMKQQKELEEKKIKEGHKAKAQSNSK